MPVSRDCQTTLRIFSGSGENVKRAAIENLTPFQTRDIQKTTRWVLRELDVNLPSLIVRVKTSAAPVHSGRFYPHARDCWVTLWRGDREHVVRPKIPKHAEHLIIARIPLIPAGRANRIKRGGPPTIDPKDWNESLICIVAHEATHFRQFLFPKNGPKWSEVEAEWSEFRLLKRWRERRSK